MRQYIWRVAVRPADQHINSRLTINLQMRLWNLRADDHVFSSRPLNFDTQSVQSENCDFFFCISTAAFHARWYLYRRYCTILTSGTLCNSLKNTLVWF
jgi:hypothetical protein